MHLLWMFYDNCQYTFSWQPENTSYFNQWPFLNVLFQASSNCDESTKCHKVGGGGGYLCGPFVVSWAYWYDGGRPGDTGKPQGKNTPIRHYIYVNHCTRVPQMHLVMDSQEFCHGHPDFFSWILICPSQAIFWVSTTK